MVSPLGSPCSSAAGLVALVWWVSCLTPFACEKKTPGSKGGDVEVPPKEPGLGCSGRPVAPGLCETDPCVTVS